jgi:hypothetical protein
MRDPSAGIALCAEVLYVVAVRGVLHGVWELQGDRMAVCVEVSSAQHHEGCTVLKYCTYVVYCAGVSILFVGV